MDEVEAKSIIDVFESDYYKYTIIPIDRNVIRRAINLIKKYGEQGLRTLDAIQLSTAVSLVNKADLFVSSDYLLTTFFKQEYLPTN